MIHRMPQTIESTSNNAIQDAESPRRVLELRQVTVGLRPETSLCLRDASLAVQQGELLLIRTHSSQSTRQFASMLQGLEQPTRGKVYFHDRDWATQSPRSQLQMRGRMGRVFDGHGWVANLNLRENLLLAKQHHGANQAEIERQLGFWADWFHVVRITRMRPSSVDASQLQIYQWMRAFLGPPSLLILERPLRAVSSRFNETFVSAINHLRTLRTAVVWLAGNSVEQVIDMVSANMLIDLRPSAIQAQPPSNETNRDPVDGGQS